MTRNILFFLFASLCVIIGLYPLVYFLTSETVGILHSKSEVLLNNVIWNTGFYGLIIFGGLALLSGWSQFHKRLRKKRIRLHKNLGKIYLISVLIGGICGVYIGFFATGGIISQVGFISLGLIWLVTSFLAYAAILNKQMMRHQYFMIFSYSACFAAVTLRLWMPLLISIFVKFETAYQIVAWLCWIPNLFVGYYIIQQQNLSWKIN